MKEIKCLENYKRLKRMLENGEKGNLEYFANRLRASRSSTYRLMKYYEEIEGVKLNRKTGVLEVSRMIVN
jgi:hypothetical protein